MPNITIHGQVGVHWGTNSSTLSTVSGLLQTRDHSKKSEMEVFKNGDGNTVGKVYYDFSDEATLSFVLTGGTVNGTLTPSTPSIGALLTITDAIDTEVAGTNWLVEDVSKKASNNGAMKCDVKMVRFSGITS